MGIRLIVEVLDHAPDDLTPKEQVAALAFAEDANDGTRMLWSGIEDEKFLRRIRVKRARLYELVDGLVTKGVLELVSSGHRHGRARYRVAELAPVQCPEDADTDLDSSVHGFRTLNHDQCPEDPDISVRVFRTPTPPDSSEVLPPPPPTPSSPPTGTEEGGGGDEEPKSSNPNALALVDALPFDRPPSARAHRDLAAAAAAALAGGWAPEALRSELERDLGSARSRTAVWLERLRPENLALARRLGGGGAPAAAPRPPWCGHCDERTRLVELGHDGRPAPCPGCHPSLVPAVAPSRNALILEAARARALASMAAREAAERGEVVAPGERWSA